MPEPIVGGKFFFIKVQSTGKMERFSKFAFFKRKTDPWQFRFCRESIF